MGIHVCVMHADKKPSVLFINIDDLNDWNSVLQGHPQAQTPNLKRFAKMSMTFSNAICSSPVCFSSRMAIFTGLHPSRTGVTGNDHWMHPWRSYVPGVATLPKYLKQHGWETVGVAKNFHGGDKQEFDLYFQKEKDISPIKRYTMPGHSSRYWGVANGSVTEMSDYKAVSHGIKMIQSVTSPLFLSIGIYKPHLPWVVPQKYYDLFPLEKVQLPAIKDDDLEGLEDRFKSLAHNEAVFGPDFNQQIIRNGNAKQMVQAYLASIAFADEQLGRLLDAWEISSHSKNGYIVLWSDHGYMLGEKEAWSKMKPWYDSSHVNLVFSGPGISRNTFCNKAVSLQDLYPTLLDLLNLPLTQHQLDGNSLKPLLKNPERDWDRPVVMSHETGGIRYDVVLDNRFRMTKLITGETELYDLAADPHEWNNLVNEERYTQVLKKLEKHLTFRYPKLNDSGWHEAESVPSQTSGDFQERKNCHFYLSRKFASGEKVVCADLRGGVNNYIDFVIEIKNIGEYGIGFEMSAEAPGKIFLARVVNDQRQADSGYPMHKLTSFSKSTKGRFDLFENEYRFDQTGLYLLRISSDVGKQRIEIDRLFLKSKGVE